jgi:uncharacterized repeat protein (TIGR01451 family)
MGQLLRRALVRVLLTLAILPVVGLPLSAPALAPPLSTWYLAEGTTRDGFDEFILVFNPNPVAATVTVQYLVDSTQGSSPPPRSFSLAANSRTDVRPFEDIGRGLDHGTIVTGDRPIVVERALYLEHVFPNAGLVNGATAVFGVSAPTTAWSFAEGTTLNGFDTFYLLFNPGVTAITVSYSLGVSDGSVVNGSTTLPAQSRATLRADLLVGAGKEGVSAFFSSENPFLAERSEYFSVASIAGSAPVNGAHGESGSQPATSWNFSEGTVLGAWYEFLTLGNPGTSMIAVTLSYQFEGSAGPQKTVTVPPGGRTTVQVFNPTDPGGVGRDVSDPVSRGVSVRATSPSPFVMERPMYFSNYDLPRLPGIKGGTVSKGIPGAPATAYTFAEGTTLSDFDTFFTFQNPNSSDAQLAVTYFTDLGTVVQRSVVVPARQRVTTQVWNPMEVGKGALGQDGRGFGTIISSSNGASFLVERPLYEIHVFPGITDPIDSGTDVAGFAVPGALSAGLSADRAEALLGETVDYSIGVSNAAIAPSSDGVVTLVLPPGFSFQPAGSSPGCGAAGLTVTCALGPIGAGASSTLTVAALPGGAPVTAVARLLAQAATVAPGLAAASVAVAETTLALSAPSSGVVVTNTGGTRARHVVVEDQLPPGSSTSLGPSCAQPPEAGGRVVCLLAGLDPGASSPSLFSWTGAGGGNLAEARADNSTRAVDSGGVAAVHAPAPGALIGTSEGSQRSFSATGGVRLRPDLVGTSPSIEALPSLSAEPVGGALNVSTARGDPSTSVSVSWVESDGTRFDLGGVAISDTSTSQDYYQEAGGAFDTRQHGGTARPDGPGTIPNEFAQVLVHGVGTLTRTDGAHGTVTSFPGAGFTVALGHVVSGGPDAPWQRWAQPGPPALVTYNYGGGFTLPADLDVADVVLDWSSCPNTWSGSSCPSVTGVPARSIVFTAITAIAGFQLGGR